MASLSQALGGALSAEALAEVQSAVDAQAARDTERSSTETVTTGAISVALASSKVSVTGTVAYTLADGTYIGQRKFLRCTVAATTPDGTVTPDNFVDGATITLDAVGEQCILEWHAAGWEVISLTGATIA
tara:strand:+ start:1290 stop:1679 length:390 start_codon:yes stop_codon:yes gene_type:complete